jgi:hypothetical protein
VLQLARGEGRARCPLTRVRAVLTNCAVCRRPQAIAQTQKKDDTQARLLEAKLKAADTVSTRHGPGECTLAVR